VGEAGFLESLGADERATLNERGRMRRFPKGLAVFGEGDRSDAVFLVVHGRVKLNYYTDDGKEVVFSLAGPGELVGELSAIDGLPRSATAVALEDVDALVLGADDFKRFLVEYPRVALSLLETVANRLRDANRKRVAFSAQDVVGRVAQCLVELGERFGEPVAGGVRIALSLSQQEIAGWVGGSREAVNKALNELRTRGWIEVERKALTILDLEGLRKRST
jgi:CRP-like cAMP-binding protein